MNVEISAETRDQLVDLLESLVRYSDDHALSRTPKIRRHATEAAAILPHLLNARTADLESAMNAIVKEAMA